MKNNYLKIRENPHAVDLALFSMFIFPALLSMTPSLKEINAH